MSNTTLSTRQTLLSVLCMWKVIQQNTYVEHHINDQDLGHSTYVSQSQKVSFFSLGYTPQPLR